MQKPIPTTPLQPSHVRMLKLAKNGPVLMQDSIDPTGQIPLNTLPVKGAVASTVIRSLQRRGLLDAQGVITQAGHGALLRHTAMAAGEC